MFKGEHERISSKNDPNPTNVPLSSTYEDMVLCLVSRVLTNYSLQSTTSRETRRGMTVVVYQHLTNAYDQDKVNSKD